MPHASITSEDVMKWALPACSAVFARLSRNLPGPDQGPPRHCGGPAHRRAGHIQDPFDHLAVPAIPLQANKLRSTSSPSARRKGCADVPRRKSRADHAVEEAAPAGQELADSHHNSAQEGSELFIDRG